MVRPLGWDWKIGCAAIASFPAREVIVGTLGVLYQLGNEEDENSQGLRNAMRKATWDGSDQKIFTVPVALSIMVFFSLCGSSAPSTLVVIRRETGRWSWAAFSFGYMTVLAYVAALLTYQIGTAARRLVIAESPRRADRSSLPSRSLSSAAASRNNGSDRIRR
ncbi:MAG: nucleoside recognition domain-containing protein [Pirellulaceae bacterium]